MGIARGTHRPARPVTAIVQYACSVCKAIYATEELATACETQAMSASVAKVGEIVKCKGGFGWYDGDRAWICNADQVDPERTGKGRTIRRAKCPNGRENCFSDCCLFEFYYVVTAIDLDTQRDGHDRRIHRVRYHLATLAMSKESGYRAGYTFNEGHHKPQRALRPPAEVVAASKKLIGTTTDRIR